MSKAKELSPEQFRRLQLTELDMLAEFDRVCRANSINYVIFGGSLLGAVRHHGYIPWDDDADIGMLRKDYCRFKEHMNETELSEEELPIPETQNSYEDSIRYRNDNAGDILSGVSGFTADNLPQDVITDIFRKGWTATEKGSYIMFKVKGSCIGVQYRRTIKKPAPVATLTADGDKASAIELNAEFDEDWGDKLCLCTALDHGENKEHTVRIELTQTHEGDVLPFYLVSIIVSGNN